MSIIIQNVAFRRLKDGSFTMTGTVPAGVKRSELVVFEDADDGCELHEAGRVITIDERASEKFAALFTGIDDVMARFRGTPKPDAGIVSLPFEGEK